MADEPDNAPGKDPAVPPPVNVPPPDGLKEPSLPLAIEDDDDVEIVIVKKKKKGKSALKKHESRRNCCGCLILFALFILVPFVIVPGAWLYLSVVPHLQDGFDLRWHLGESETVEITEAEDEEILILAKWIHYDVERTEEPIVFVAQDASLSGTFEEKVVFRGIYLTLEEGSAFEKGIEIHALELRNRGAVVEGAVEGSVFRQKDE